MIADRRFAYANGTNLRFVNCGGCVINATRIMAFFRVSLVKCVDAYLSLGKLGRRSNRVEVFIRRFHRYFNVVMKGRSGTKNGESMIVMDIQVGKREGSDNDAPVGVVPTCGSFHHVLKGLFCFVHPFTTGLRYNFCYLNSHVRQWGLIVSRVANSGFFVPSRLTIVGDT